MKKSFWCGFFFLCLLDFRNVYEPIDCLQGFRCIVKGFLCCFISGKARKDIHGQGCGKQAGAGSEPVVQHWILPLQHQNQQRWRIIPSCGPSWGMIRPVWMLTNCECRQDERGDRTGEQDPADLIYCRWFNPAQPPTEPWVTLDEPLPFFVPLCPAIFYLPLSYRLWAVCFRHVCTALRTKGPWSHWWPLSPSATCFIIK